MSPYTVAFASPSRSASSVMPSRGCPEPSSRRIDAARRTDWIIGPASHAAVRSRAAKNMAIDVAPGS